MLSFFPHSKVFFLSVEHKWRLFQLQASVKTEPGTVQFDSTDVGKAISGDHGSTCGALSDLVLLQIPSDLLLEWQEL